MSSQVKVGGAPAPRPLLFLLFFFFRVFFFLRLHFCENGLTGARQLCVMGDGGVGKTASTIQFVANHFVEMYDPTIEDSYKRHIVVDDTQFLVDILDTAGQDDFSPLRDSWIRESEGFLLIFSVTDRNSLQYLEEILVQIERTCEGRKAVPIVLAGNKCDLVEKRQISTAEGKQWAQERGLKYAEFSAKTRDGVSQTFEMLVREVGQVKGAFGKVSSKDKKTRNQACAIL